MNPIAGADYEDALSLMRSISVQAAAMMVCLFLFSEMVHPRPLDVLHERRRLVDDDWLVAPRSFHHYPGCIHDCSERRW